MFPELCHSTNVFARNLVPVRVLYHSSHPKDGRGAVGGNLFFALLRRINVGVTPQTPGFKIQERPGCKSPTPLTDRGRRVWAACLGTNFYRSASGNPATLAELPLPLAERGRFELPVGYKPTHAFQACALNHSAISPLHRAILKKHHNLRNIFWRARAAAGSVLT